MVKESELKKSAFFGMIWKLFEGVGTQLVSLVVSIILARLLTPDDYSVVSIVTIFFAFCNVFISGGFNMALIQKKDADKYDYSSVLHISLFIAILIYGVLFVAAPWIADVYRQPLLVPVFRVMGIALLIDAFKSVLCAYISNQLQFKKFFFATLGGTVLSACVGIFMALKGFGPWALVAQKMTNSLIGTVILFASTRFRIVFSISWNKLKGLFNYGWKIFVASLISTTYDQINPLIIGVKYSSSDLAYYSKGQAYPSLLHSSISGAISAVLFPVMSKVQDSPEKILGYTRKFVSVSSYVIFPIMVGFMAVSDNFVALLLTDKWMPAATYMKIFCITYMFNIIQTGNLQAIRAIGRSDIILKLEIAKKSIYFVVIVGAIMVSNSPEMLAMATIINTLVATILNTAPNKKLIGYSITHQLMDVFPNLLMATIMGVLVYAMGALQMHKLLLLGVQVLSGAVIYIVLSVVSRSSDFRYLCQTLRNIIKKDS